MKYISTRDKNIKLTPSQAIIKGLSDNGGLFVPESFDGIKFDVSDFVGRSYNDVAKVILAKFLDFSDKQIEYCVDSAYNTGYFENSEIFTMHGINTDMSVLELFKGKTAAFKDAALSILPYLMECARENEGEKDKILILTATSGDTGKAAISGFSGKKDTDVITFYPYKGVSKLQLLQMLTQEGDNVSSVAVKGNFDDTQNGVKEIFNNTEFKEELAKKDIKLSSANSINIGRLLPQIVYYYYSYARLIADNKIKAGDKINFVVPTGNFGNILAGYYAKLTGLPVNKLVCASNDNNVLFDFFKTGVYDKNREFKKTISPSMDILISSNLERLIFHMLGDDDKKTAQLMDSLKQEGKYELGKEYLTNTDCFIGGYATEKEIKEALKDSFDNENYLMDTHTAAGYKVYKDEKEDLDGYTVILSTASPFKFSAAVYEAIYEANKEYNDDVEYMYALSEKTGVSLPKTLAGIEKLARKEEVVIDKSQMKKNVKNYVEGK